MSLQLFNCHSARLNKVVINLSVVALFIVFFVTLTSMQSFAEEDLDRWMEVPFSGIITIKRTRDSNVSRGEMSIHVQEQAGVTATITGTKRIVGRKGEHARLFPEGTLNTHINMETVRQSGEEDIEITQTLNAQGIKTFTYDPKKSGAKIANLMVNPGKGLYRLKLQSGRVEGEILTVAKVKGQERAQTVKGSWEVGAYLADGYLNVGEKSYNPARNSINDSASMTAFTSTQFTPTHDGSRAVMLPDDPLLKGLQSYVDPVKYTVTWNLTLGESPGKAVLLPVDEYPRWMPELRHIGGNGWEGNTVSVIARIMEPEGAKGIIEFQLEDVSNEPGICMNEPTRQAGTDPDLEIPSAHNRGMEIGSDSLSAKTKGEVNEATVVIRAKDFGAHGRLTATVTLVTPKGEVNVRAQYEKLGIFHVSIPQDRDDNYIADQWQRENNLGVCDGLEDKDNEPLGATDGDGLSLYEEYRGFMINDKHERLNPLIKDLFIYDSDGLVHNSSFVKAVDPLKVWYVSGDQLHAFDPNNPRVVNFNHDSHHLVDQHGLVVKDNVDLEWEGDSMGNAPGSAVDKVWGGGGWPGRLTSYISVYTEVIREKIGQYFDVFGDIIKINRRIKTDAAWAAFKEGQIGMWISTATMHECGHAIGMSHHKNSLLKSLPDGANLKDFAPDTGYKPCVMRYLVDKRDKDNNLLESELLDILEKGDKWPNEYCNGGDDDCMGQIRISDHRKGN